MQEDAFAEEQQLRQKYFNLLQRLQTKTGGSAAKELAEKRSTILWSFKTSFRSVAMSKKQDKARMAQLPIDGDVKRGSEGFLRHCSTCHSVNIDSNAKPVSGPFMGSVYGRITGSSQGFAYSTAIERRFLRWNRDTLNQFILAPQTLIADNKCGIAPEARNPATSADIVEFLKKMTVETEKNVRLREAQKIDTRAK